MKFIKSKNKIQYISLKVFLINFGPQHPAAHGVLRLIVQVHGETMLGARAHIGLLHRGTEKLMEIKTYLQLMPYFDRFDYVSMMSYEHTYVLLLEKVLNIKVSLRISYYRMIFLELTRILNHMLCICCQAMDLGAVTPYFFGFEEREKIFEFYERVAGARMHAGFFRVGNLANPIPKGLNNDILIFIKAFKKRVDEVEALIAENRIWKERLVGVGVVTSEDINEYGVSGVVLRSAGIQFDLRKQQPYERYYDMNFSVPVGKKGDSYDRYLLRMEEMRQSCDIIGQCICKIASLNNQEEDAPEDKKHFYADIPNKYFSHKDEAKSAMEELIQHFLLYHEAFKVIEDEVYLSTEAPKGEFGILLISNGSNKPYRIKIKAPGFTNLQVLDNMSYGHQFADLVTVIGTLDIVFGEVDR